MLFHILLSFYFPKLTQNNSRKVPSPKKEKVVLKEKKNGKERKKRKKRKKGKKGKKEKERRGKGKKERKEGEEKPS